MTIVIIDSRVCYGYIPVRMKSQKKIKTSEPFVFTKPDSLVHIQLRYKVRDENGKLQFKDSKNVTAYNVKLEEAYERIIEALQKRR